MAKKRQATSKLVERTENRPFALPTVQVKPEPDTDGPFDDEGLNIRQRKFVDAYVGEALGNGTKAAEIAGYKSDNRICLGVQSDRLLNNVYVQKAIAKRLAAAFGTPENAVGVIADAMGASMAAFVDVDADGRPKLNFRKAKEAAAMGHIREFEETRIEVGGEQSEVVNVKAKIKLYDRLKAAELYLKVKGLLVEKHDHEHRHIISTSEQLREQLRGIRGRIAGVPTGSSA